MRTLRAMKAQDEKKGVRPGAGEDASDVLLTVAAPPQPSAPPTYNYQGLEGATAPPQPSAPPKYYQDSDGGTGAHAGAVPVARAELVLEAEVEHAEEAPLESSTGRDSWFCSIFLLFVGYGLAVALLVLHVQGVHVKDDSNLPLVVALGVTYVISLFEAGSSPTARALWSKPMDCEQARAYIEELRQKWPVITWRIECYHDETRTSTDDKGRTTSRTEKVVTHRASQDLEYQRCVDQSAHALPTLARIFHPDTPFLWARLDFKLVWTPGDSQSAQDISWMRECFYRANKRDTHQTKTTTEALKGLRTTAMVTRAVGSAPPKWWMRLAVFALATLLLLSGPYRFLFNRYVGWAPDFVFTKALYTHGGSSSYSGRASLGGWGAQAKAGKSGGGPGNLGVVYTAGTHYGGGGRAQAPACDKTSCTVS